MNKWIFICFFALFGKLLIAQSSSEDNLCRMKITSVLIQGGGMLINSPSATLHDFKILAPESELLKSDFSGYNFSGNDYNYGGGSFNALMGFSFLNNDGSIKPNPLLRLGVHFFNSFPLTASYYNETSVPYDTLISNGTGQVVYVDSVTYDSYSMEYESQNFRIDGSLIFRTNPSARWSIYAGAGFDIGVSFNNTTNIEHAKFTSKEASDEDVYYYLYDYYEDADYENESFRNKTGFGATAYIPMGVDFRIANKNTFFRRLHLFLEFRPGLSMYSVPELDFFAASSMKTSFGLQVDVTQ